MDEPKPPPDPNPNPNPNPNNATLCEVCRSNPWKYRCPGCSLRSCSLPCVNSHKQLTACTGKRKLSEVVPLAEFDDNLLISDYNLLEEVKRLAESSCRMRDGIGGNFRCRMMGDLRKAGGNFGYRMMGDLWKAAARRKIRLWFVPMGMSRRESNKTQYSAKNKSIFWTIEWRFHSTDVVLIDHNVDENTSLSTAIKKHLTPGPWNNKLRPYCNAQLEDLKFFTQSDQKSPKSPFRLLSINAPIGKQLAGTRILEYPVIHVFLPSHSYDFTVEKWELPVNNQEPRGSSGTIPSPQGPLIREEEIEEGEVSPYTGFLDRLKYASSAPPDGTGIPKVASAEERAANLDGQTSRASMEVLKPSSGDKRGAHAVGEGNRYSKGNTNSMKLSGDAESDFDKELRDFYSDFIGEMNPDDFLSLDDEQGEEDGWENAFMKDLGGEFLLEEELEEGEIPS